MRGPSRGATNGKPAGCIHIVTLRPQVRLAVAALAAALAVCATAPAAPAAPAVAAPAARVGEAESLAPHLLLIHGGGFLFDDPSFEPLTREAAQEAGFVPHYLHYPLGDLPGAVRATRSEARRLGGRHAGPLYAYGSSAGGTLAALLAGDGFVRAAVAKAPPSDLLDWPWPLQAYGADYFERIGAAPEARRRLSPLRRPARRPLLLVHGRRDAVVPLSMSEAFAARFRRVHLWAPDGGHHVERVRPWVLERSLAWLAGLDRAAQRGSPGER